MRKIQASLCGVELDIHHLPRFRQAESALKQIHVGHAGAPIIEGRRDHRRQPLDQVSQRPVGLALRPDDHPGPEIRQCRPVPAQQQRRLVPAAQMLGMGTIAEPSEVDDALDPLVPGHSGEAHGGGALPGREIPGAAP